nr:MAG TPA: hypothetical protein [Caudoviricetes sp.]
MKLEVGQFVRTKDGKIGKYFGEKAYESNKICIWTETTKEGIKVTPIIDKNTIVKASYNIIDILEEGDIIRYRIDKVSLETKGYLTGVIDIADEEMIESIKEDKNYHVLQILTKEQFEEMSYKVKESK